MVIYTTQDVIYCQNADFYVFLHYRQKECIAGKRTLKDAKFLQISFVRAKNG
jgi:hypothetical protein